MAVKTPEEYRESLKDGRVVYFGGERVGDVTTHPTIKVCVNLCSTDYVLAQDVRYQDLFAERDEEGELVPFVYVPARSSQDLHRRRQIIQTLARTCFGWPGGAKFTGIDGLNGAAVVCRRMDKKLGTDYTQRVENYRKFLQKTDPAIALCMTDVKGDRSLRPSKQQPHQDYYLRVVEQRGDGIVVRGCKTHISLSPCCNEMIVLPTRNMSESDKDYAVAFATPLNAKGITIVCSAREAIEEGNDFDYPLNSALYGADATIIFDDVFVPTERVFMNGEWEFSGDMAYVFADFHRVSADAYKYPELEILVGAALLMAEYNGLDRADHIREKLSWLVMYAEGTEALGRAACDYCVADADSDLVYPNPLYSNIAKFFFADNYHTAIKHVQDITGGITATIPSSKDFLSEEIRPLLQKYFGGKVGVPTEHRVRAVKLVKDLSAVLHAVTSIHAEGSLAAQRLSIFALADFERFKTAARRAARVSDGSEHPLFAALPSFPGADL
jgi:4-hydroxybutyryl-CoA dehydratase/vinylacetyl-CoA-Delta-isomerase